MNWGLVEVKMRHGVVQRMEGRGENEKEVRHGIGEVR